MSDIIDNLTQHRFELHLDGHIAAEYYRRDGKVITLEHTEVPSELGGGSVRSSSRGCSISSAARK